MQQHNNPEIQKDILLFVKNFTFQKEIQHKTFLVTGASGFIGSMFIRTLLALNQLLKSDIHIIAIARSPEKIKNLFPQEDIKWIYQDVCKPLINENILDIDYIIHCATPTKSKFYIDYPVETIHSIITGTDNLLKYAKSKNVSSIVYLSSIEVYGSCKNEEPIKENYSGYIDNINVRSSYSLGKRMAECLCHSFWKEYNTPVKIARLTQTFGVGVPISDQRVFAQFAKSIIQKKDIIMHTQGESSKPYCYITDAISAIFFLLFKGENGEAYNVANDDTYISIYNMANMLVQNFSSESKIIIEEKENMGYAPTTLLHLSSAKLKELGWRPHYSLKEMFERLIAYYQYELNIN